MAWTDPYATAAEYRGQVDKSITTDDTVISRNLNAVSRMLEQELGRVFNQSSAGEARYFDTGVSISDDDPRSKYLVTPREYGTNSSLPIDDLVTMTELASDLDGNATWETIAAAGDTILRPYNAAISGKPYTSLILSPNAGVNIGGYAKSVRITGTWGWPSVPAPIKEATIQLAAILRIESPRAQAAVSEIGQLVTMSAQGRGIIDRLVREYSRKALIV